MKVKYNKRHIKAVQEIVKDYLSFTMKKLKIIQLDLITNFKNPYNWDGIRRRVVGYKAETIYHSIGSCKACATANSCDNCIIKINFDNMIGGACIYQDTFNSVIISRNNEEFIKNMHARGRFIKSLLKKKIKDTENI